MANIQSKQQAESVDATSQELAKGGHFGPRLRLARKERGWTLKDVSATSGISVTYLSDLETGKLQNPTLDTMTSLAAALGMSMNSLLGIAETEETKEQLPLALVSFCESSVFMEAVQTDAQRFKVPAELVVEEWKRLLGSVSIFDAVPASDSDYDFIFQTVRRVLT